MRWIIGIIGLLAANVIAMVTLAAVANNGHTQVIPEYYDRAVHYDDAIDRADRARALGWHADATIVHGIVEIAMRDAAGAPVGDAKVRVTGYQRAHASETVDVELVAIGGGRYRGTVAGRAGVHDLVITADRGADRFTQRASIEAK